MRRFVSIHGVLARSGSMILCVVWTECALALLPAAADAGSPEKWEIRIGGSGGSPVHASGVGAYPGYHDGYDGGGPLIVEAADVGIFIMPYHKSGLGWTGATGFYPDDFESSIPPGGSKTWWDFYLWAQNWTLDPPGQVQIRTSYEDASVKPPDGYTGHLMLDYVPPSCNWTGPTDFWLNLTQWNTITLPCATVTNPLQGTRFHMTVYTTVPEPSSFFGLAGLSLLAAGLVRKRRR